MTDKPLTTVISDKATISSITAPIASHVRWLAKRDGSAVKQQDHAYRDQNGERVGAAFWVDVEHVDET